MRFNTQPPEGGWHHAYLHGDVSLLFQHTAARRRLVLPVSIPAFYLLFQHTAARRRLVTKAIQEMAGKIVSTHSRPKAAGFDKYGVRVSLLVSTHSRPKAAGHPPPDLCLSEWFQHTAARRRLVFGLFGSFGVLGVSTHSRPKAAGLGFFRHRLF